MDPKVKLVYFDVQGRGEVARIILAAGKVEYEDYRVPIPTSIPFPPTSEWAILKPRTPFGSLPILYWNGEEIPQSMAIVRFLAKQVGLAGNTDMEFARADTIADHTNDFWPKIIPARWAKTQEERVTEANAFLNNFLPDWLSKAENLLKKRGGLWFSGVGLTFGDIAMEVHLDFITNPGEKAFLGMDNQEERAIILDSYPLLKDNFQRVRAVPEIAQWIESRPVFNGL